MNIDNNYSIVFGNKTDVGQLRQRNEDYMECFNSPFGQVFIVCDGMGGHEGGEIASRLAVSTIKEVITNNPNNITNAAAIIQESISVANRALIKVSTEDTALKGMGTTCVILIIKDQFAFYGHVGDSRIYMIRNNQLYLMTRDHSFVQGLVDQGLISWEEAEHHPRKNEITQALGIFEKINPEVNEKPLELFKGDRFILCSDGLSGVVAEKEILNISINNSPVTASDKLIDIANHNGGPDNITVQIVEFSSGQSLPEQLKSIPPSGSINRNVEHSLSSNSHFADLRKTREIKQYVINNEKPSKKRKLKLLYFGVIVLITVIVIMIWNPFSSEKNPIVKSNLGDTNKTKIQDTSKIIPSANDKSYLMVKTFLEKIYRGNDLEENFKLPDNIIFNIDYVIPNSKPIPFDFEKFKRRIKEDNLRKFSISDSSQRVDINKYFLIYEIKKKDIVRRNKLLYEITGQKISIFRIELIEEHHLTQENEKTTIPKPNNKNDKPNIKKGNESNVKTNEENGINKTKEEEQKEPIEAPKTIQNKDENK